MLYLAEALRDQNIPQMVLCARDGAVARYCDQQDLPYRTARPSSWGYWDFARQMARLSRDRPALTLVHAHDAHAHSAALSAALAYRIKLPLIVSRRVDFPIARSLLSRYKYRASQVKRILCVSKQVAKIVCQCLPQIAHKTHVVYSGIAVPSTPPPQLLRHNLLRSRYRIAPTTRIVAQIAALAPHKDYPTFIRSAEILGAKRQDVVFLIVGEGTLRAQLVQRVKRSTMATRIFFTGFCEDVAQILQEVDVCTLTSSSEGLGTTILDAFAYRVPVAATMAGGIPEMVVHQQSGLLADVGDAETIAENIARLLDSEALVQRLTHCAYARLCRYFSKTAMVSATLMHYRQLSARGLFQPLDK